MGRIFEFVAGLFGPRDFRNLKWKMFAASAAIVSGFYLVKYAFPTVHIQFGSVRIDVIPQSRSESLLPLGLLFLFAVILLLLDALYDRDMPREE